MKRILAVLMAVVMALAFGSVAIGATDGKEVTTEKKAVDKVDKADAKATKATKKADGKSVTETKCISCHKGDKALDKIVAAKGIKDAGGLVKAVKEGPKAKLHSKFTDKDLNAVGNELFAEKKGAADKKTEAADTKADKKEAEPAKKTKKKVEGC